MRGKRIRELLEKLAEEVTDQSQLAIRISALEDQASLTMPILDEPDLDRAIDAAAERIALRHGLQPQYPVGSVPKGKHHRQEELLADAEDVFDGKGGREPVDARFPQRGEVAGL